MLTSISTAHLPCSSSYIKIATHWLLRMLTEGLILVSTVGRYLIHFRIMFPNNTKLKLKIHPNSILVNPPIRRLWKSNVNLHYYLDGQIKFSRVTHLDILLQYKMNLPPIYSYGIFQLSHCTVARTFRDICYRILRLISRTVRMRVFGSGYEREA